MALSFITGRAGSGKTTYMLEKIKNENEKSIIIVPEQVSLSMEREAVLHLDFLGNNCDVLSFNRLFHRLYKKLSGKKREYISSVGKTIIINRLLYKSSENLKVFKNADKFPMVSGQLLKTFSEFKKHGISPDILDKAIEIVTSGQKQKFADLKHLYSLYVEEIEKRGFDSEDNLSLLCQIIENDADVKNTNFYIDSFWGFTSVEINIISALVSNAKNVFIILPVDNKNEFLFSPAITTKNKICRAIPSPLVNEDIVLKENKKHKKELYFLEENYAAFSNKVYKDKTEDIKILVSDSPYTEADLCAWEIYNLVKNNNYKYGDIAVVTTDNAVYSKPLEDAFLRYDIDFHKDEKLPIARHSLCAFFLNILDVCISNFDKGDVVSLIKSGYLDLSYEDILLFENYLNETGIKGSLWKEIHSWDYLKEKFDIDKIKEIAEYIANIILPFKDALSGGKQAKSFCEETLSLCERAGLSKKVTEIAEALSKKGELQKSVEYSHILQSIFDIINEIKLCMEETKITITKFKDMLCSAFAQSHISSIPASSDRVIIGSFQDSMFEKPKVLFVLGANSNSLPPKNQGTGIITDAERRILEKNNITLAPDNKTRAMEAPLKIYSLITSPSEKLYISYPLASQGGASLEQADLVGDIKELFLNVTTIFASERDEKSLITTPSATLNNLSIIKNKELVAGISDWFEKNEGKYNRFKKINSAKYFALSEKISKETAQILFKGRINATVSRLEQFARCPFSFFAKYGLKLNERKNSSYKISDAGTFMHSILEHFTNYIINEKNNDWISLTDADCEEIAKRASADALEELKLSFPFMNGKQEFLLNKLQNAGIDTAKIVVSHIKSGKMIPIAAEYKLSDNLTPFEVTTNNGNKLTLYGTVDRIDTYDNNFRIIDYKSSDKTLDLQKVYAGQMLQLFLYSAAMKNKLGNTTGMFYLTLNTPVIEVKSFIDKDQIETEKLKSSKMSGFMIGDEKIAELMDENYQNSNVINVRYIKKSNQLAGGILSKKEYEIFEQVAINKAKEFGDEIIGGNISVTPFEDSQKTSCTYCPYNSLCGFDPLKDKFNRIENISKEEIIEIYEKEVKDE